MPSVLPALANWADAKAPNLGPFKSIKVVDPSVIYLKDGSGATLVELDVELKVD